MNPADQFRDTKAKIDSAQRAAAQAEVLAESARSALQVALEGVAAHVPIAGKNHDQLIADLDAAIADADRDLASSIQAVDAAVTAFQNAKAGAA